jgi:hypothetical protein
MRAVIIRPGFGAWECYKRTLTLRSTKTMRIFAITHAERLKRPEILSLPLPDAIPYAGPFHGYRFHHHSFEGFINIAETRDRFVEYINTLGEFVKIIASGTGRKHEELLRNFKNQFSYSAFTPHVIQSPGLGTEDSTVDKHGTVETSGGNIVQKENWLPYTGSWEWTEQHFGGPGEGISILCTGKPYLMGLKQGDYFRLATVYELLPSTRDVIKLDLPEDPHVLI